MVYLLSGLLYMLLLCAYCFQFSNAEYFSSFLCVCHFNILLDILYADARRSTRDIFGVDRVPKAAGGTGLYLKMVSLLQIHVRH